MCASSASSPSAAGTYLARSPCAAAERMRVPSLGPSPDPCPGFARSHRLLTRAGNDRRAESSLQWPRQQDGHETYDHATQEVSIEQLGEVEGGRRRLVDQASCGVGLERHQPGVAGTGDADEQVPRVGEPSEEGPPGIDAPDEVPAPTIDRVHGAGVRRNEDVVVREE